MNNKKISEFLEENSCRSKKETIKKLIEKFSLDKEEAEELYQTWKKEYMKFKG